MSRSRSNYLNRQVSNLTSSIDELDTRFSNLEKKLCNQMGEVHRFGGQEGSVFMEKLDKLNRYLEQLKDDMDYGKKKYILDKDIKNDMERIYNTENFVRENKDDRMMNHFSIAKDLVEDYEAKCINYVAAILDPEYNYTNGLQVKQPSLLNPPSVSIPLRTLTTINSNLYHSICIAWNPATFCTPQFLNRIKLGTFNGNDIYANKVCSVLYALGELTGNVLTTPPSSWDAKVFGVADTLPEIGVAKARLVSSKIKISFRGSVLNQGGTIMGCATYEGFPSVVTASSQITNLKLVKPDGGQLMWKELYVKSNPECRPKLDQTPFDEKTISNGIWSKNVNITEDASGICAVYVPTDPMDQIFYKPGTYYGETIEDSDTACSQASNTIALSSPKGAHLNYLFVVQGLPEGNTNPITVETYTTWEVLPTNLSASSLRNFNGTNYNLELDYVQKVQSMMKDYFNGSTGVHPITKGMEGGFLSKIKSLAKKGGKIIRNAVETYNKFNNLD